MIKHFIFTKIAEKLFKKAIQGDRQGIIKSFKIVIIVLIVIAIFVVVGLFLFIQFLFGLFTQIGSQADLLKNANEIKIEESIKNAKEKIPEEVSMKVEQVKEKIAPYETFLKDAESIILKASETVERFENIFLFP